MPTLSRTRPRTRAVWNRGHQLSYNPRLNRADAIAKEEVKRGFQNLLRKVRKLRPRAIAILTLTHCPVSVDGSRRDHKVDQGDGECWRVIQERGTETADLVGPAES